METLGMLVDKLCISNTRMWHLQDELYVIRRMTPKEFKAKYGGKLDVLHKLLRQSADTNLQRNALMDEIDTLMVDVATGKRKPETLARPQHKLY